MRLFALRGQTLFAPRFRSAQPWAHAHNPAPPRGVEDAAPYIFRHELSAIRRGGIPPFRAVSQYHKQKRSCRQSIVSTTFSIYTNLRLPEPAQEINGLGVLRALKDVGGGALLTDDAVRHVDYMGRYIAGKGHLMGDDKHR